MNHITSNAMIVEFIGTPGAGKTTYLPVVKEFFASRGLHAWSINEASRIFAQRTKIGRLVNSWSPASLKGPLLWQVFYQASRMHQASFRKENQILLDSVLRFQRARPISDSDKQHVLHWFINLSGQYHFLKEHAQTDDILIFDEGFIHRVVQLFASEAETLDDVHVKSYLSLLPVPDLIITPQASLETCIERVYRRGIWERFKDRGEEVVSSFMSNAYAVVNLAVDYIRSRDWPVIQIINDHQPSDDVGRQLLQKLDAYYEMPTDEEVFNSINN